MKKFLNINKQRIMSLFFAFIIAGFVCIFGSVSSVFAAESESNMYIYFIESSFTYSDLVILPYSGSVLLYDGSSAESSALLYVPEGYEESPGGFYYQDVHLQELIRFETDALYIVTASNRFLIPAALLAGLKSATWISPLTFKSWGGVQNAFELSFDFVSNGESFTGIRRTGYSLYYLRNSDSTLLIFNALMPGDNKPEYYSIFFDGTLPLSAVSDYATLLAMYGEPLNLIEYPSFLDRVTSGLSAVISWVGTVVTAIVSGELVALRPLVAIGIAVSSLLLAWVFIRRSIWGS